MFLNPMLFAAASFTTPATPQTVVDDLLNADRSFSSTAAATDPASGLAAMLDADAVTPVPGKGIVEGRDAVTAVLRSSLLARGDKIGWMPRSEEHTSELQSLMRISYAIFCLNKTTQQ